MHNSDFIVSKPAPLGEVQDVVINPYCKDLEDNHMKIFLTLSHCEWRKELN